MKIKMAKMMIVKRPSINMKIEWSSILIGVPSGFGEPRVIIPERVLGMAKLNTGVQHKIMMVSKIIMRIPRRYCLKKITCPSPI